MKVVESFVMGKHPDQSLCEDVIISTPDFVGVVDGATDKSGARFEGKTGGKFAADVIASEFSRLPADSTARAAVEAVSVALRDELRRVRPDVEPSSTDGPTATLLAFSAARNEVWRVGDAAWISSAADKQSVTRKIDAVCGAARGALIRAYELAGREIPSGEDPGRALIKPLLEAQYIFRNNEAAEDLAFGAIDGGPVPDMCLEIFEIDATAHSELAFGSDGYQEVFMSLAETERQLERLLRDDPMLVRGEFPETKGLLDGMNSFDDRAYIRFDIVEK